MSMVHLNMINMVDVENGIHLFEPGLFFRRGAWKRVVETFSTFSFSSRREKLQNFLYTLNQHRNDFFSAFFILKFATNEKGRKAAN